MTEQLRGIRDLLIDMDGVLYRGKTGLPGGQALLTFLEEQGIGYLLVTNNSTLNPGQFVTKLAQMGISVGEEHVMNSGAATAEYLTTCAPRGAKVYVLGEQGLVDELEKRGFVMAGRDADFVVVGMDRGLTYDRLNTANLAIRAGARFIGTNPDTTYPLESDIVPGAGAMLAALVACTNVLPTVIGKPEPIQLQLALRRLGAKPEETAIVGDRLDTDILGGHRAGLHTILVLTGITSVGDIEASEVKPELVYDDLPALIASWRRALEA